MDNFVTADCLKAHVLDARKNVLSELMTLEQAVVRMFATSLNYGQGVECNEDI